MKKVLFKRNLLFAGDKGLQVFLERIKRAVFDKDSIE